DVGKNLFMFMFNNEGDRAKVMKLGLWLFDKHILLVETLDEEVHSSSIFLSKASFWIRVFGVPYLCLSKRVGKIIGESIRELEDIEIVSGKKENSQCLKERVRVDVRSPIRRVMKFLVGGTDKSWLNF
ncbi:DUF4283 domain-containing protein, partial [Cephalotus follicularis]